MRHSTVHIVFKIRGRYESMHRTFQYLVVFGQRLTVDINKNCVGRPTMKSLNSVDAANQCPELSNTWTFLDKGGFESIYCVSRSMTRFL